jgi:hypothetical protein
MSNPYPPPYGSDPYQQPQTGYSQPQGDYSQYQQSGYGQPAYGQTGYGQPAYAQQPILVAQPQTNNKAVVSLILGIASWVVGSILTGIPAVIIGHMAMREIDNSAGTQGGKPLAIIGLVLGYLSIAGIVGACLFFIFVVGIFGAAGAAGAGR